MHLPLGPEPFDSPAASPAGPGRGGYALYITSCGLGGTSNHRRGAGRLTVPAAARHAGAAREDSVRTVPVFQKITRRPRVARMFFVEREIRAAQVRSDACPGQRRAAAPAPKLTWISCAPNRGRKRFLAVNRSRTLKVDSIIIQCAFFLKCASRRVGKKAPGPFASLFLVPRRLPTGQDARQPDLRARQLSNAQPMHRNPLNRPDQPPPSRFSNSLPSPNVASNSVGFVGSRDALVSSSVAEAPRLGWQVLRLQYE